MRLFTEHEGLICQYATLYPRCRWIILRLNRPRHDKLGNKPCMVMHTHHKIFFDPGKSSCDEVDHSPLEGLVEDRSSSPRHSPHMRSRIRKDFGKDLHHDTCLFYTAGRWMTRPTGATPRAGPQLPASIARWIVSEGRGTRHRRAAHGRVNLRRDSHAER